MIFWSITFTLTHTHIPSQEKQETREAIFAALDTYVITVYQTAQTDNHIISYAQEQSVHNMIFLKRGNRPNVVGRLVSSELQMLAMDCCWTPPGCYTVKMFNQNEKSLKTKRDNSEERLCHQSLHPKKKKTKQKTSAWMDARAIKPIYLLNYYS